MNELREEIELPPFEIVECPHNPDVCECDLTGLEHLCTIKPTLSEWVAKHGRLAQREAQLKSSLAANREHERQFSDIQDSIIATFKDFGRTTPEHFASQIRYVCSYYRGAMDTINALDAAKKELELANREQKAEIERLKADRHELKAFLSCAEETISSLRASVGEKPEDAYERGQLEMRTRMNNTLMTHGSSIVGIELLKYVAPTLPGEEK